MEDPYDHYPPEYTRIFTLHRAGQLVGTIRTCNHLWNPQNPGACPLPCQSRFHDELLRLVPGNTWILETSKLALFRHPRDRSGLKLANLLFSCVISVIKATRPETIVASVRPHHFDFYKRLGMRCVSPPRQSAEFRYETQLLLGNVNESLAHLLARSPQLDSALPAQAIEW